MAARAVSIRQRGQAIGLAPATALVALAVYWLTIAPDLSWANAATDGGELITASVTLGISHPPGYPTYVLLGKLFSFLPIGPVAFRYNLFSAICAAGAAALLAVAIVRFWGQRVRPLTAASSALAFAFLPLVWSQALVAEVYALNLLLLAAFLLAWSSGTRPFLAGACLGLALTAHLTSLLILPAALLGSGHQRGRVAGGIVAGLVPLLLLPALAQGNSPVVWGWPETWRGWWWLVSGQLYAANVQFPPAGERLSALLMALAFGPALVAAGEGRQVTRGRMDWTGTRVRVCLLGATAALYVLFAALYATPDAAVLLLPALLLLALLVAPTLQRLRFVAPFVPLALVVAGYSTQTLAGEIGPRPAAEALLAAAPRNALLLTPGDRTIFTLWYFHHVEGQRPDLRLADASLFAFDWYRARLAALYPELHVPAEDDLEALQRLNEKERPFCRVSLLTSPLPPPDAHRGAVSGVAKTPTMICYEAPN